MVCLKWLETRENTAQSWIWHPRSKDRMLIFLTQFAKKQYNSYLIVPSRA